jgi:hypothetical protein
VRDEAATDVQRGSCGQSADSECSGAAGATAETHESAGATPDDSRDRNRVRGKVIRAENGQFVVRGADNKEMTFHTNPKTRYWHRGAAGQWNDIRVGSTVNAWYGPLENDRYYVNTVDVVPVEGAVVQPAPTTSDLFYEGHVVRVVGTDQVIIRLADGKEITVYVGPQTTYRFNEQPGTFTTLQPGLPIRVDYYIEGGRPHARGFLGLRRR